MGGVQSSTVMNGVTLPPNFSWIDEGKLAGCGLPQTKEELQGLAKIGIGIVINLTEVPTEGGLINTGYRYPSNIKEGAKGLQMVHISVPDGAPPTNEQMDVIACKMGETINSGKGAVVHCYKGEGRTGTMIAAFFVKNGATADEAISFVRSKRAKSIHTKVQEDAVRAYEGFVKLHQPDNDKIVKDQNLMIQLDGKYILVKVVDPEPTVDLIEMMTGVSAEDIKKQQAASSSQGGNSSSSSGTSNSNNDTNANSKNTSGGASGTAPNSSTTNASANSNSGSSGANNNAPTAPTGASSDSVAVPDQKATASPPAPSTAEGRPQGAFSLFGGRPPQIAPPASQTAPSPAQSETAPPQAPPVGSIQAPAQPSQAPLPVVQSPPAHLSQRVQLQPDNDENKSFISDIRTSPSRRLQLEEVISPEKTFSYQSPVNIFAMNDMLNSMNSVMDNMMNNMQRRSKLGMGGGMKQQFSHTQSQYKGPLGMGSYRSWEAMYTTTG